MQATDEDARVTLFHGTTVGRSAMISVQGFRSPDLQHEIAAVAERFSVSPQAIRDDLVRHNRYTHLRGDDRRVYATTGRMHAESYASRAPEVEWECLWSVYRLAHPEVATDWNQRDHGHLWVTAEQAKDPPAVLELDVPAGALVQANPMLRLDLLTRTRRHAMVGAGHEVVLPIASSVRVIEQVVTDRWVDGSLLRFMSGLSPDQIGAEVADGLWGQPVEYRTTRVWRWRDVLALLPPQRRDELGLAI